MGGAEVLAARLARRLTGDYRFVFACLDASGTLGDELRDENFRVALLDRKPGVDGHCARRLARFLAGEGVDLVHTHQYTPFFYALAARMLYRRVPILFTEHGRPHPDYPRRKRIAANKLLLQSRDRVVAVGQAVRHALVRNEGIPDHRVEVIYNGIETTSFAAVDGAREAARRELGLGPEHLAIMQVARLDPLKDHATALRTIERVARLCGNARLILVGEGSEEGTIRAMIRERKLASAVHLLGLRKDVARLLPAADIFLLTSVTEGIPVTLIEAMAASLPIVATRVGGVGEVVLDGQTGLLAPAGDEANLAKAILRLAADPAERLRMGQLGRERAGQGFSEATMHEGYRRLYDLMGAGRA